jgi:hypothetical protein
MRHITPASATGRVCAAIGMAFAIGAFSAMAQAATWGIGHARGIRFGQTPGSVLVEGDSRDIKTDGYCVYQAHYGNPPSWTPIPSSRSCYHKASYLRWITRPDSIRLYRDDGRYETIAGAIKE